MSASLMRLSWQSMTFFRMVLRPPRLATTSGFFSADGSENTHIHAHTHTHTRANRCTRTHASTHAHTHTQRIHTLLIYICVCEKLLVHVYFLCLCVSVYVCVCMCWHMPVHVYIGMCVLTQLTDDGYTRSHHAIPFLQPIVAHGDEGVSD